MAGMVGIARKDGIATGTALKTLIQLVAAANHGIDVSEVGISFHGLNNSHEPITVDLLRQTDAGTMTALTVVKANDSDADTLDTTAQHTATAEPTAGDVLRTWAVHPQTGLIYQPSDEGPIHVGAGDRVGLRVNAANGVDADAYIGFKE